MLLSINFCWKDAVNLFKITAKVTIMAVKGIIILLFHYLNSV